MPKNDDVKKFVFTRINEKFLFTRIIRMKQKGQRMNLGSDKLVERELTFEIIGGFYTVYNALGYGFLEGVYSNALSLELERRGLRVRREVPVEVLYEGQPVGLYRMDMVVEGKILIENKSTAAICDADRRQLFNYLRATDLMVGLLFHFGPKPSYHRFVSSKLLQV